MEKAIDKSMVIFVILMVILPLVTYRPWGALGWELPKVFLFQIGIELMFAITLLKLKTLKRPNITILLFFTWLIFTTIVSIDPQLSFFGSVWRRQGLLFWIHCLMLLMIIKSHLKYISIKTLAITISLSCVPQVIIILYQSINLYILKQTSISYAGRVVGTFGQPNFVACYLVMCLPFTLFLINKRRQIWTALSLLTILGICLTLSRSGILACMTILFSYFLFTGRLKKYFAPFLAIIFILLLLTISYIRDHNLNTAFAGNRIAIWQKAITLSLKHPVTGYGLDTIGTTLGEVTFTNGQDYWLQPVDRVHNLFGDILLTSGGVGLILFVALCYVTIRWLLVSRGNGINFFVFLSILGFLVYGLFETYSAVHWFLFWVIIGYANLAWDSKIKSG